VLQSPNRRGCKYEDWLQQKDKAAILGVNSNWITPNILAMSRPSDRLVEDQAIIFQVSYVLNNWFYRLQLKFLLLCSKFGVRILISFRPHEE
jgi:hypothetical protein